MTTHTIILGSAFLDEGEHLDNVRNYSIVRSRWSVLVNGVALTTLHAGATEAEAEEHAEVYRNLDDDVERTVTIEDHPVTTNFIGHDTHDVIYCCSLLCQDKVLDELLGDDWDLHVVAAGSVVVPSSIKTTVHDHVGTLEAITVDFGATPGCEWPDYDVHCGSCEVLLHEGTDAG